MSGFGFADERRAIESFFKETWDASTLSQIPVVYENQQEIDDNGQPLIQSKNPWIRLSILSGEGNQITIGEPPLDRWTGIVTAQIFVRSGEGTGVARQAADIIAEIFTRQKTSSGDSGLIRFGVTGSPRFFLNNDGWYQVNVSTIFHRDRFDEPEI